MKAKSLMVLAAAVLGLGLVTAPANAAAPVRSTPHFYSIDVDNFITDSIDTFVAGMATTTDTTLPYVVVGSYLNKVDRTRHGFIGHLDVNYKLVDAQQIADPDGSSWVYPMSVNSTGTVVGFYLDPAVTTGPAFAIAYGFIRDSAGNETVGLTAPGADTTFVPWQYMGTQPGAPEYGDPTMEGTFPNQIGTDGTITGYYTKTDASAVPPVTMHGFTLTGTTFSAPIDRTGASQTVLFGRTPAGMLYGSSTIPSAKNTTQTSLGLTISTNRKGQTVYSDYLFSVKGVTLPNNFCGWTNIAGISASGLLVGDAGNGCSINGYAWTKAATGGYTNFVYVDPTTKVGAYETIITGVTSAGIIYGAQESSWTQPPGGWLSPSEWYPTPDPQNPDGPSLIARAAFGNWHGFIQTPN